MLPVAGRNGARGSITPEGATLRSEDADVRDPPLQRPAPTAARPAVLGVGLALALLLALRGRRRRAVARSLRAPRQRPRRARRRLGACVEPEASAAAAPSRCAEHPRADAHRALRERLDRDPRLLHRPGAQGPRLGRDRRPVRATHHRDGRRDPGVRAPGRDGRPARGPVHPIPEPGRPGRPRRGRPDLRRDRRPRRLERVGRGQRGPAHPLRVPGRLGARCRHRGARPDHRGRWRPLRADRGHPRPRGDQRHPDGRLARRGALGRSSSSGGGSTR